jgi:hypothetical protein
LRLAPADRFYGLRDGCFNTYPRFSQKFPANGFGDLGNGGPPRYPGQLYGICVGYGSALAHRPKFFFAFGYKSQRESPSTPQVFQSASAVSPTTSRLSLFSITPTPTRSLPNNFLLMPPERSGRSSTNAASPRRRTRSQTASTSPRSLKKAVALAKAAAKASKAKGGLQLLAGFS